MMTKRFNVFSWWAVLLCLSLVGCGRQKAMRSITAGHSGCTDDEVEIIETDNGFASTTWLAECRGTRYVCSGTGLGSQCSLRVPQATVGEELVHRPVVRPGQRLTFATEGDVVNAVRATFVSVDSRMALTVGPDETDYGVLEVESETRVPLTGCGDFEFHRANAVTSEPMIEGRARFRLEVLARVFDINGDQTSARFCGRVLLINAPEAALFARLQENVGRISSAAEDGTVSAGGAEPAGASALIRARLDAANVMLHACAGTEEVLRLIARWDRDGNVSLELDDATSEVNECIRSAVAIESVTGEPGQLVHVVPPTTTP